LYANEPYWRRDPLVRLLPSSSTEQMHKVLEALAQLQGWDRSSVEDVITKEAGSLPWGVTVVVVTAIPTEGLLATMEHLHRAGRRVALVVVGETVSALQAGRIPVYRVSDQVHWREVETLKVG